MTNQEPEMSSSNFSRREAVVMGGSAWLAFVAAAQARGGSVIQPFGKDKDKDKDKDKGKKLGRAGMLKLITMGDRHDWTLKIDVTCTAYTEKDSKGMPNVHDLDFTSATIVFPVLDTTASSRTYKQIVKGEVTFNDRPVETELSYQDKYPAGTRLAKWDMKQQNGREMRLQVDIPMTCWETKFDEATASKLPWPAGWSPEAMSTFLDRQALGRNREGVEVVLIDHTCEAVKDALSKLTNGKDPKTVAPVALAKYIAGELVEKLQPSGNGVSYLKNSGFEGFDLIGAERTILEGRGTEHDVACALAAVYRAAGLPARLVIGYDISDKKGDDKNFLEKKSGGQPKFRTWVEFCLRDDDSQVEMWIPVDINRQRKISSKTPRNWRFFGDNEDLDTVLPISHQFHPPTSVVAHGAPCFWGWITVPEVQLANQFLRFNSITTPKTATSDRDRLDPDDRK